MAHASQRVPNSNKNTAKINRTLISRAYVRKHVPPQTLITTSAVKISNVFGFIATTNPPHKSLQSHQSLFVRNISR